MAMSDPLARRGAHDGELSTRLVFLMSLFLSVKKKLGLAVCRLRGHSNAKFDGVSVLV